MKHSEFSSLFSKAHFGLHKPSSDKNYANYSFWDAARFIRKMIEIELMHVLPILCAYRSNCCFWRLHLRPVWKKTWHPFDSPKILARSISQHRDFCINRVNNLFFGLIFILNRHTRRLCWVPSDILTSQRNTHYSSHG